MLDRMVAGEVPAKPHTALRDGGGRLRNEECLTRDGFDGPFTIMYHVDRPHTAAVTTAGHGWEIPASVDDKPLPLARRHYRSQELARRGGPPLDARVPLLFNADVVISVVYPDETDPVYFANGDGDDLYFVVEGGGVLRSALGDVTFAAHDYVFVPKGLLHRFLPDDPRRSGCQSNAPPASGCRGSGATRSASCAWTRLTATAISAGPCSRARATRDCAIS